MSIEKPTKGERSRQLILKSSANLFLRNGYNATGINEILQTTNLPKGSFYYQYKSKKELGLDVCTYFENELALMFNQALEGKTSWEDFINSLVGFLEQRAEQKEYFGCPLSVLGMETILTEPDIANCSAKALRHLCDVFNVILIKFGIPESEATRLAFRCMACYEGFLTYYRISLDKRALKEMKITLIDMYLQVIAQQ